MQYGQEATKREETKRWTKKAGVDAVKGWMEEEEMVVVDVSPSVLSVYGGLAKDCLFGW